ncbi:protein TIFY 5A-like [Dorcoceras hygrometricum]|uniref:Protein TIFY 5A-like n=1 Tax=Dorcoceras hygrometricum TaxID=472368 RepID=A0A2Z7CVD1_9LAMI|nr:protein TIFY 5A-like [Dorcoceras hygrometricum]
MKRNCNLELRLATPRSHVLCNNGGGGQTPNPNHKDLGEVSVSDFTQLQARAMVLLASREMEEKSPVCSPTTGLYMKRSLQRFLQKRKTRSQQASPYPLNPNN